MRPRDEEHDLARDPDRQPDVARDPRSRGTTRWAPRLGRRRVEPPDSGDAGSAPQTPVASTTTRARTSSVSPVSRSQIRAPTTRPPSSTSDSARGPGHDRRAVLAGRAGDRERVARVVLDPVVEHQAAAQPLAAHRRGVGEHLGDREVAMPAAVLARAEHVVQGHPGLVEGAGRRPAGRTAGTAAARSSRGAARGAGCRDRSVSASRTSPNRYCSR